MASEAGQLPEPTRFDFRRIVGRSASSVVWEATQISTGRAVALKVLSVDLADEEAVRRFDRERHVMGMLSGHPHIVTIHDAGIHEQHPWLAMQFCSQGSLAAKIKRAGPLPVAEAVEVLIKIGGALAVAHQRGVLHCDVKPANIMINDFGEPALGDFGIARLTVGSATRTVATGYSLDHAPPELLNDERPTVSADVYSLGTTIWELLCGRAPFRQSYDTPNVSVIRRILLESLPEPTAPDVPAELTSLLMRMAAKEAGDRPASMDEVVEAARNLQARLLPQSGHPPAFTPATISKPPPATVAESHTHSPVSDDDVTHTRTSSGIRNPQAPPFLPSTITHPPPARTDEDEDLTQAPAPDDDVTHTQIRPGGLRTTGKSPNAFLKFFQGTHRGLLIAAAAGLVIMLAGFAAILITGQDSIEGTYEISATEYECFNINLRTCEDPDRPTRNFTDSWRITDCSAGRCSIYSSSGRWDEALELVRDAEKWSASGTLSEKFSYTCDLPVTKVSTEVTISFAVDDRLAGTHRESIPVGEGCSVANYRAYEISGDRR
ncbi:MAG: protein kinase domain-containing protein [Pseudonocardiaceae bacterium]